MAELKEEWMNVTSDTSQCILKVPGQVKVGAGEANIGMTQAQWLTAWAP